MFLGMDAFCGLYTSLPQYLPSTKFNILTMPEGTYRLNYISENPDKDFSGFNEPWDYQTHMKVDYKDGKFDAGSSVFSLHNTDTMVIQIREKGEINWMSIYDYPIEKVTDFNIREEYKYAKNDTEYEFMVLSLLNGMVTGQDILIGEDAVMSEFDRIVLADKDTIFSTGYNITPILYSRIINNQKLELLHGRYPSVISYDENNYDNASVSVLFLEENDACDINQSLIDNRNLRNTIKNWLANKKPKVLKDTEGNVIIFNGMSSINE